MSLQSFQTNAEPLPSIQKGNCYINFKTPLKISLASYFTSCRPNVITSRYFPDIQKIGLVFTNCGVGYVEYDPKLDTYSNPIFFYLKHKIPDLSRGGVDNVRAAVITPDKKVLLFEKGVIWEYNPLTSQVWKDESNNHQWGFANSKQNLLKGAANYSVAYYSINNKIYIFYNNGLIGEYDLASNNLSILSVQLPSSQVRANPPVLEHNGKIYIFPGGDVVFSSQTGRYTKISTNNQIIEFDPINKKIVLKDARLPFSIIGEDKYSLNFYYAPYAMASSKDGKIYIFGGVERYPNNVDPAFSNKIYAYLPEEDRIYKLPVELPEGWGIVRGSATEKSDEEKIYVFQGLLSLIKSTKYPQIKMPGTRYLTFEFKPCNEIITTQSVTRTEVKAYKDGLQKIKEQLNTNSVICDFNEMCELRWNLAIPSSWYYSEQGSALAKEIKEIYNQWKDKEVEFVDMLSGTVLTKAYLKDEKAQFTYNDCQMFNQYRKKYINCLKEYSKSRISQNACFEENSYILMRIKYDPLEIQDPFILAHFRFLPSDPYKQFCSNICKNNPNDCMMQKRSSFWFIDLLSSIFDTFKKYKK